MDKHLTETVPDTSRGAAGKAEQDQPRKAPPQLPDTGKPEVEKPEIHEMPESQEPEVEKTDIEEVPDTEIKEVPDMDTEEIPATKE